MLEELAKYLNIRMQQELILQDHVTPKATLLNSMQAKETRPGLIEGSFVFYGRFVDTGRAPGVKRVPLQALIDWIILRRLDGMIDARRLAFMIQAKIFKEGIPTANSRNLAPRRTNLVGQVLDDNMSEIEKQIADKVFTMIDTEIINSIRQAHAYSNTTT